MPKDHYTRSPYPFFAGSLGHIEGATLSASSKGRESLHYFGGIPYALPPLGPYRFRKPRPLPEYYRYGTKANPGRFNQKTAYCPQPRRNGQIPSVEWDEDCLQLNVYIPAGRPSPSNGWPVFFYIHGGFLQWGSANDSPESYAALMHDGGLDAIIIAPAYRLNLFGFIAGRELHDEAAKSGEAAGNLGFWDQRTALEWTAKNIGRFGGNASNITVGGYSAGSHSTFHQLAHELYFVPDDKAVIRQAIMWSNSPGVQPRSPSQHQKQFDEVLEHLDIPLTLSAEDKLKQLRNTPETDLVDILDKMRISEFRATTDDSFVSKSLIANIDSGDFGRRMKARGIRLMNGECRDEHTSYRTWRTPSSSYEAVRTRLIADYPEHVVDKLMKHYCKDSRTLPSGVNDWTELFGRIYADMQVHCLERGFLRGLQRGGMAFGTDLLRYRIEWRSLCIDDAFPPSQGITHASDLAIWFWGLDFGNGLSESDKEAVRPWVHAFAAFVRGNIPQWGTNSAKDMRRLRSDGKTDVWEDDQWERGLAVWDLVNGNAQSGIVGWLRSKL